MTIWSKITSGLGVAKSQPTSSSETLFIQIGDVADLLPKRARAKLIALRQEAEDALVLVRSTAGEIDELRLAKIASEERIRNLLAPLAAGGFYQDEESTSVREERAKLNRTNDELRRRNELQRVRSERRTAIGGLVQDIEKYLRQTGRPTFAEYVTAPKKSTKAADDIPAAIVARCRTRFEELTAQIRETRSAPIPSAKAKEIARYQIEAFSERGRPEVDRLIAHGEPVAWPTTNPGPLIVDGGNGGVVFPAPGADATALLAWLHRDELIAKIETEIDANADDGRALSDDKRAERLHELAAAMLEVERAEEAAIELANASGGAILRRREADPRAVLGLADDCPAPVPAW